MYYVIGADGNQYGPVDEGTLRAWIAEGRAGATSLSFKAGDAQWVPLRDRAEFGTLLAAAPIPGNALPGTPPLSVTPGAPKDWLAAMSDRATATLSRVPKRISGSKPDVINPSPDESIASYCTQ